MKKCVWIGLYSNHGKSVFGLDFTSKDGKSVCGFDCIVKTEDSVGVLNFIATNEKVCLDWML